MALAAKGELGSCLSSTLRTVQPRVARPLYSFRRRQIGLLLPGAPGTSSSRSLVQKIAAVEEQQTFEQEQPEQAVDQQEQPPPQPEVDPAVLAAQAELEASNEVDIDELDQAQEDLLKWMLYTEPEAQEQDMDEMIDYDEFGDEEYEEIWEEVEEMLEENDYDLKPGDKVVGTVYECDEDGAYVEIGAKTAGFVSVGECSLAKLKSPLEVLRPGMKREFVVLDDEDEYGEVLLSLGALEGTVFWHRVRQLQEEDIAVSVTVLSANKGGLLVQYEHLEGFMPISHLGSAMPMGPEELEALVGQTIPAKFLEVDEEAEKLVFSNRRASMDAHLLGFLVGDVVIGTVQSVKAYGAFIDIGGATGLLHISQISHERVTNVEQVLAEGDKLKVMILSQDPDRGRITLSTKKLEPTPGDMFRNPQAVFEGAENMARQFQERVNMAESAALDEEGLAYPAEYPAEYPPIAYQQPGADQYQQQGFPAPEGQAPYAADGYPAPPPGGQLPPEPLTY